MTPEELDAAAEAVVGDNPPPIPADAALALPRLFADLTTSYAGRTRATAPTTDIAAETAA